uniref:SAP domain-containing protein n=1 Tax=Taenia asiatica TaxID=60517 RepID=A0A0R3W0H4_TAEAS
LAWVHILRHQGSLLTTEKGLLPPVISPSHPSGPAGHPFAYTSGTKIRQLTKCLKRYQSIGLMDSGRSAQLQEIRRGA